ncbi:SGNH/GDSL hydrolase family protein [Kangiella sp. HZ709]|uniref:SGNH/GDSL hydrolase family protein n=1 Tax=Kangiella sp. HZ709 TaxID=2666328 RepID=UPI0012AFE71D|nr:SGNH/GDSL hydrolase family protein [Kangiella sp. HZ709]MRX27336.1 hypothetical protein [Kangiella sp. HZ709]
MLKRILFWLLMPFAIPQGIRLKNNAPRFEEATGIPEGVVKRESTDSNLADISILGFGDSIISGVGIDITENTLIGQTAKLLSSNLHQSVTWQLVGKTGYNSGQMVKKLLPHLPDTEIDFVITSVGVNDVTSFTRTNAWQRNLQTLFESIHTQYPKAQIVFNGMPPLGGFPLLPKFLQFLFGLRAKGFDKLSKELCQGYNYVHYLESDFDPRPERFAGDGYHPNKDSCTEWAEEINQLILQLVTKS